MELTERRCKGYTCMAAAVHRTSPIVSRQGPNQLHMRLYHDLVEFVRALCVLWRLQWGARRQRKSAEVLNDPKGIWGGDFDQIPVSIILDVIVRTAFFVLWAMQHRCTYGGLSLREVTRNSVTAIPANYGLEFQRNRQKLYICLYHTSDNVTLGRITPIYVSYGA